MRRRERTRLADFDIIRDLDGEWFSFTWIGGHDWQKVVNNLKAVPFADRKFFPKDDRRWQVRWNTDTVKMMAETFENFEERMSCPARYGPFADLVCDVTGTGFHIGTTPKPLLTLTIMCGFECYGAYESWGHRYMIDLHEAMPYGNGPEVCARLCNDPVSSSEQASRDMAVPGGHVEGNTLWDASSKALDLIARFREGGAA